MDYSKLSDEELAEEYKSYFLQTNNDLPKSSGDYKRYLELANEVERRDSLEVLESVRVLKKDEEGERQVLAE